MSGLQVLLLNNQKLQLSMKRKLVLSSPRAGQMTYGSDLSRGSFFAHPCSRVLEYENRYESRFFTFNMIDSKIAEKKSNNFLTINFMVTLCLCCDWSVMCEGF